MNTPDQAPSDEKSPDELTNFQKLCDAIGTGTALNLCEIVGGNTIYICKTMESESTWKFLVAVIGDEGAEKLLTNLGGKRVYVPKAPPELLSIRNAEIVKRMRDGENCEVLALAYSLTPRRIVGIVNDAIQAGEQQ